MEGGGVHRQLLIKETQNQNERPRSEVQSSVCHWHASLSAFFVAVRPSEFQRNDADLVGAGDCTHVNFQNGLQPAEPGHALLPCCPRKNVLKVEMMQTQMPERGVGSGLRLLNPSSSVIGFPGGECSRLQRRRNPGRPRIQVQVPMAIRTENKRKPQCLSCPFPRESTKLGATLYAKPGDVVGRFGFLSHHRPRHSFTPQFFSTSLSKQTRRKPSRSNSFALMLASPLSENVLFTHLSFCQSMRDFSRCWSQAFTLPSSSSETDSSGMARQTFAQTRFVSLFPANCLTSQSYGPAFFWLGFHWVMTVCQTVAFANSTLIDQM